MVRLIIAFSICALVPAQDASKVIVLASRHGAIEFVDPATLSTLGRIQVDLPAGSAGLNGVAASADGRRLYVEGPLGADPSGCCWLYAIDLDTLQSKVEAGIGGSGSRNSLVISNGVAHPAAKFSSTGSISGMNNDRLFISPDAHWIFGVRSFRGPAVDIYDTGQGLVTRQLVTSNLKGDWDVNGSWLGGRFYMYAANTRDGSGQLWTVSPNTADLGEGIAIPSFGEVAGCSDPHTRSIVSAGDRLFVYDTFGFKNERCFYRNSGGAWILDPSTGQVLRQVAPGMHFSALTPDSEAVVFGLVTGGPNWQAPVQLVRIDARDGRVVNVRVLDTDFWRMALAPAQVRSGVVNLIPLDDPMTPLQRQR